jgi:hypothetical protein
VLVGSIWLRTGTVVDCCEHGDELSDFINERMQFLDHLSLLLASQEEICPRSKSVSHGCFMPLPSPCHISFDAT